jgi:ParB family transcriptional regulator, chromosome partitioning protein
VTHLDSIINIPICEITVLNPRTRSRRLAAELKRSIQALGLKRPITVRQAVERGYELVCGQGRLEAYRDLGFETIPAVLVDAEVEDSLVMSLVENLARRGHSSLELLKEVRDLRTRGHCIGDIARKTDFSSEYVSAICGLFENGEERLLAAVEKGIISPGLAMEIARIREDDVQAALVDAFERKMLTGQRYLAIRRIVDMRKAHGKSLPKGQHRHTGGPVTANSLIKAYQRQADKQKALTRQASLARNRLRLVIAAMQRLLKDDHFIALLRAEGLSTVPRQIIEKISEAEG